MASKPLNSKSLNQSLYAANAADAFARTLKSVRDSGIAVPADESKSVGANRPTRELQNFTICVEAPRDRLIRLPTYKTPLVSSVARFVWMMAGNNRLADIAFYEEKARAFSDDGLTMPGSNYGMRMLQPRPGLNQLTGVISELQEHPSSRRAMVAIYHPEDAVRQNSSDIPCTFGFDYLVRSGQLFATTIMRSNNAIGLLPFNLFEFSMLAEVVAVETGSKLGPMSHIAMSMHIYENELGRADGIIAAAGNAVRVRMPEMPKGPLAAVKKLALLETEIRHSGHLLNENSIDQWIQKAGELGPYWGQFYLVLLFNSANKISSVVARAVREQVHAPFTDFMPEATGPAKTGKEALPLELTETGDRSPINLVSLDSRRMQSVRRHIEHLEASGKPLPVATVWRLQEHFLRVAARSGGEGEVSEADFLRELASVRGGS
jgi:thymidylate synthase